MDQEELSGPAAVSDSQELERLIQSTARGDTAALSELYRRTRGAVYALALSMTGSAFEAEELCHDAYLRVWDCAGSYRPKGSPMAWILTVTKNLCLMSLRRRRRRGELSEEEWDAIPASSDVSAEDRAALQDALAALEPQSRQIVLLHAVSGLKHREIGKLLGLPLGTVLSKYKRAIEKLKTILEGA